jgi:hypothetical protein
MLLFKFLVGLLAEAGLVPWMRMTEKEGPDLCMCVARYFRSCRMGVVRVVRTDFLRLAAL